MFSSNPMGDGDEENLDLRRNKTTKLNTREEGSYNDGKKKDMGKVKCFACHNTSHYVIQCPTKKKGKEKTQFSTLV